MLETYFGNEQAIVTVPYSGLRRSPLNTRTQPLPLPPTRLWTALSGGTCSATLKTPDSSLTQHCNVFGAKNSKR
jgi:hypothetical protein